MNNACEFCKIQEKETEKYVIFEDDHVLAFLDVRPLFLGHTLLIPKQHYATFYDLPDSLITEFFLQAKKIGKAIEKALNADGSFIAMNNIVSQSVPHFHLHIVPRKKGDGLKGFFWPRTRYQHTEEMLRVQSQIKNFLR